MENAHTIVLTDYVKYEREGELLDKAGHDFDEVCNQFEQERDEFYVKRDNYYEDELAAPKVAELRKLLSRYQEDSLQLAKWTYSPEGIITHPSQQETDADITSERGDFPMQETSSESSSEESQGESSEPFVLQDFIEKLTLEQRIPEIGITGKESLEDMAERHFAYQFFNPIDISEKYQIGILLTDTGRPISLSSGAEYSITLAQEAENLEAARKWLGGDKKIRHIGPAHSKSNCHGKTFADGIGCIDNENVITILQDNNYKIIQKSSEQVQLNLPISTSSQPQKGDVIVYLGQGDQDETEITHSGRLSEIKGNNISFISKWGDLYGTNECDIEDYLKLGANTERGWVILRQESKKDGRKAGRIITWRSQEKTLVQPSITEDDIKNLFSKK